MFDFATGYAQNVIYLSHYHNLFAIYLPNYNLFEISIVYTYTNKLYIT